MVVSLTDIIVSVLASSVSSGHDRVKHKTIKLVFAASPLEARNIKENEQRLVGPESGQCVRVERLVYPWTVVSVS